MEFIDLNTAFDNAIAKGIFSLNRSDINYVGNFMYMHSANGIDYFKHVYTRKYGYDLESVIKATAM
jgi:hypothetical protein